MTCQHLFIEPGKIVLKYMNYNDLQGEPKVLRQAASMSAGPQEQAKLSG
jgi:hypothetical protein